MVGHSCGHIFDGVGDDAVFLGQLPESFFRNRLGANTGTVIVPEVNGAGTVAPAVDRGVNDLFGLRQLSERVEYRGSVVVEDPGADDGAVRFITIGVGRSRTGVRLGLFVLFGGFGIIFSRKCHV